MLNYTVVIRYQLLATCINYTHNQSADTKFSNVLVLSSLSWPFSSVRGSLPESSSASDKVSLSLSSSGLVSRSVSGVREKKRFCE